MGQRHRQACFININVGLRLSRILEILIELWREEHVDRKSHQNIFAWRQIRNTFIGTTCLDERLKTGNLHEVAINCVGCPGVGVRGIDVQNLTRNDGANHSLSQKSVRQSHPIERHGTRVLHVKFKDQPHLVIRWIVVGIIGVLH